MEGQWGELKARRGKFGEGGAENVPAKRERERERERERARDLYKTSGRIQFNITQT